MRRPPQRPRRNRKLEFVRPKTNKKSVSYLGNDRSYPSHLFDDLEFRYKIAYSIYQYLVNDSSLKIWRFYFKISMPTLYSIDINANLDRIDNRHQLTIHCGQKNFTIIGDRPYNIYQIEYNDPNMFNIINQALKKYYLG